MAAEQHELHLTPAHDRLLDVIADFLVGEYLEELATEPTDDEFLQPREAAAR